MMIWCMLEDFILIWCMLIWFDPSCVVVVVGGICLKFYFDMMHVDMIWVHFLFMYALCLWCFCLWNFIKAATSCGQHRPTVLHAWLRIRQGSSCPFHRERRGKLYEWNFDQSFWIDENDCLTFGVHFLTDAPATAHEGSRGSWAYGLRRSLRAVLQESPAVGFRVAIQASAADACPRSSHSSDWPVATGDPFFPSAMRGDDGDPRGLWDDYCHADRGSCTHRSSGEGQLAGEGHQ